MMALVPWLPHAFPASWFINSFCVHVVFERSTDGEDIIYPELLLAVEVVRWNKLLVCWQIKDKKNFLLTINNYLLKTQFPYIYIWKLCHFYCFRETDNWSIRWCCLFTLLNFSESEIFAWEALVLEVISFHIRLSSVWTSDISSCLTLIGLTLL